MKTTKFVGNQRKSEESKTPTRGQRPKINPQTPRPSQRPIHPPKTSPKRHRQRQSNSRKSSPHRTIPFSHLLRLLRKFSSHRTTISCQS